MTSSTPKPAHEGDAAAPGQIGEERERIRRLKHQYATYCDEGYSPEGIASLFVEDGIYDGGVRGYCEGAEAIKEFYAGKAQVFTFARHFLTNDAIEVAGDLQTATGTWYLLTAATTVTDDGPSSVWVFGRYDDEYRLVDGEWKFTKVTFAADSLAPANEGWHKHMIRA